MKTALINLRKYPVDQPDSAAYKAIVAALRNTLVSEGVVNIEEFLTASGIETYRQEIDDHMDVAFHAVTERNPFGYYRSDQHPDDHALNTFGSTESYRLAHHHLPDTAISALYHWPPMRRFIADITDSNDIYLSGDPSNALVVQVYKEGCGQAWHFDQALFSTIINLAESEQGGLFEYVPDMRTEDEPNYEAVKAVLDDKSERVQSRKVKAGSFSIMLGRYTMHRVTKVEREQPRISVILSYELQPGVRMDLDTRKISFGPTAPEIPGDA